MQGLRVNPPEEVVNAKPRKKKALNQMPAAVKIKGEVSRRKEVSSLGKTKGSKRSLKTEASVPFQEMERMTPDSLTDASGSSDEYRALRRKYLLLEEESFSVERELNEVSTEVKTLEDEKSALLDQLVVLEGLIDPSEIQRGL